MQQQDETRRFNNNARFKRNHDGKKPMSNSWIPRKTINKSKFKRFFLKKKIYKFEEMERALREKKNIIETLGGQRN